MSAYFREVFAIQAPALLRYVRRVTGSRADAEEIVQETFMKLHCQLSDGAELPNVRAWLFRVATNAARDLERERRVRAREQAPAPPTNVVDFETRLQNQQLTQLALRRLPRRMRQLLLLWSEGFSYREMAGVTGVEPGYIGVLLQRARAAFKKEFEQRDAVVGAGRNRDGLL
ncbi:MAG TPA: RNA polymerase sigma factor [Thermoanaerobaculia bacterium]|nr:RNA polymerase sigma factor [Thermoanaerobaculia bacterium]